MFLEMKQCIIVQVIALRCLENLHIFETRIEAIWIFFFLRAIEHIDGSVCGGDLDHCSFSVKLFRSLNLKPECFHVLTLGVISIPISNFAMCLILSLCSYAMLQYCLYIVLMSLNMCVLGSHW